MRLALLLLVVVAFACRGEKPSSRGAPAGDRPAAPSSSFVVTAELPPADSPLPPQDSILWSFVDTLHLGRDALSAKLGSPISVRADTVRNPHDTAQLDSLVSLRFASLEAQYLVASGQALLVFLSVDRPRPGLPFSLNVGQKRTDVEARLGQPPFEAFQSDTAILAYWNAHPGASAVNFYLVKGVVKRIAWMFFVD